MINVLIDEFFIFINLDIFILYSYNAFYDVYLKSLLYVKFIIICVVNKVSIY